ncbi:MAG: acyl carrier protein [Candidatus Babeliales bacterium]
MGLSRQETTDKIRALVAEVLKVDAHNINPDASFKAMGADSLDLMEILMKVEDAFDITIPEQATMNIDTVNQAADALMKVK